MKSTERAALAELLVKALEHGVLHHELRRASQIIGLDIDNRMAAIDAPAYQRHAERNVCAITDHAADWFEYLSRSEMRYQDGKLVATIWPSRRPEIPDLSYR